MATIIWLAISGGVIMADNIKTITKAYFRYFFNNPDLPPEIKALEKRSLSSAYFEIGYRCSDEKERFRYLWRSLKTSPRNWLANLDWIQMFLFELSPDSLLPLLKILRFPFRWWRRFRNSKKWLSKRVSKEKCYRITIGLFCGWYNGI